MKDMKDMTHDEREAYLKQRERELTASVGDFINYLKAHFKPSDHLCWIDCVEGYKYDVTPVSKEDFGKKFFRRIKDIKQEHLNKGESEAKVDAYYPYVQNEDILVI